MAVSNRRSWPGCGQAQTCAAQAPPKQPDRGLRISRRSALALAAASFLPAALASTVPAGPAMRLASAYSDAVYHTANLRAFAQGFSQASGVPVEVSSNASLLPMSEILPALKRGELDLGEILLSAYAQRSPLMGIDALPFIVRDFQDARLLWSVTRPALEQDLLRDGVHVLYAVPWPAQGLFSVRPVRRLQDLREQRFRVYNAITQRLAELSSAHAVTIAASDLAASIERGDVDAMITSSVTGVDSRAWTRMRHFLDLRAWIPKNAVCMSSAAWDRLSETQRQALREAARQAEQAGWELAQQTDLSAQRVLQQRGFQIERPSPELHRALDRLGERSSTEWATQAGVEGALSLLEFYRQRG